MSKFSFSISVLILAALSPCGSAATIGAVTSSVSAAPVGVATPVTFTATITDSSLIPGSVDLLSVDSAGRTTIVGIMHDDGLNGDATAGDHIYSFLVTVFQQTPGTINYRVSAAFQGSLVRPQSGLIPLTITGVSTALTITSPVDSAYLNIQPIPVTGSVGDPSAAVKVNGITAQVSGTTFSASVPLQEGINTLTAVAQNSNGTVSTASETVTLDTTPPHITIDTPSNNAVTTAPSINVAGIVNDIVVGTVNNQQATVTVNGIGAQVTNRTYSAVNVPLIMGSNTIQATGRDRAGNFATATVTVVRQAATQPNLSVVSGNNLTGSIGTLLAAPLVVALRNGTGQAIPNTPIVFTVTGSDGTVSATAGRGLSSIAVNTNAQGQAQVFLTLGSRAGAGNNIVTASSAGIATTAVFTESANSTAVSAIVVDSGNDQSGVVGQPLPLAFIAIVTDAGHNRLGNVPVTFTVTQGGGSFGGQTALTTTSDSDGRVQAVLTLSATAGPNAVTANFTGNTGLPATFTATGLVPGPAANTTISGVVLDNSNNPIVGVTMRLYQTNSGANNNVPQQIGTPVRTNAQGYFQIAPAPVGVFKLMADGTTSTSPPGAYPTLEYDMVTVAGQNNTVGAPIYLPQISAAAQVCVTATTGGTLTTPQAPGFALNIAPGSATFPGGTRTGCVSVTPVNPDKIPMVPGFGQQPRFIVTIQPVGTTFNPPASITIPNVDGLAPRVVTEMYSYDHDLATFTAIGTGTVSADGSVISSDAGVGVLKAGWHCGGDPASSGSSGSLSVSLAGPGPSVAGSTVNITASGTPPQDGQYVSWQIIDDPADPNDDPSVGQLLTMPTCASQPTCVAQLKGVKFGTVTVRVSFTCTTTGATVMSNLLKVTFTIGLNIKDVSFLSDIDLSRDRVAAFVPLTDPVWKSTNAAADNGEVAYVRNNKIQVSATFDINPPLPAPITGVTVQADIPGLGKVQATNQTLSGSSYSFPATMSDTALPNTTKYFSSMTFNWKAAPDGSMNFVTAGTSANPVYVTLDTPRAYAMQGGRVPVTLLKMAIQNDGATDQASAIAKTWQSFSGPANITTWDSRQMIYYQAGVGFNACALDYATLITSNPASGQCGSFAKLLLGSLAVNNVQANFVVISVNDGAQMIVKNWTFAAARYAAPAYKWKLDVNPSDPMVPDPPGSVYGDLTNVNGLPGQNSPKPSEKIFALHFIVNAAGSYYDPSYGVTYTGAAGFETSAIAGYAGNFGDGTETIAGKTYQILRVRMPSAPLNITFANDFSN